MHLHQRFWSMLLVAILSLDLANCIAADAGPLLWSDDFATLDAGWNDRTWTPENGTLSATVGSRRYRANLYSGKTFGNCDIRVDVIAKEADNSHIAGLMFWGLDDDNYYAFRVSPDGMFGVSRRQRGKSLTLHPFIKHKAVRIGLDQTNSLRVVIIGHTIELEINGEAVATLTGTPPTKPSHVGLICGNNSEKKTVCGFARMQVRGVEGNSSGAAKDNAQVPFEPAFATWDTAWGLKTAMREVREGTFSLQVSPNSYAQALYQGTLFDQVDVEADVVIQNGGEDQPGGIVFWGDDTKNFYAASVLADGKVQVQRLQNGRWLSCVRPMATAAVRKGLGSSNTIRVRTSGRMATVLVNNQEVVQFRGFPPAVGSLVGFCAEAGEAPSQWSFAKLRVRNGGAPSSPSADPNLFVSDNFATLDPAWGVVDDSRRLGDRQLLLDAKPGGYQRGWYQGAFFQEVDVRMSFTAVNGNVDQPAGIIFWATDYKNHYQAVIYPDGKFGVRQVVDDKPVDILPPFAVTTVRTGLGQANELRVATYDRLTYLYVNDEPVGEISGVAPEGGGRIGFYVSGGSEKTTWALSNVQLRRVGTLAAERSPLPTGDRLLFADDFATVKPEWVGGAESIRDGKMTVEPKVGYSAYYRYKGAQFGDIDAQIQVRNASGELGVNGGLLFWTDDQSSYLLSLRAKGEIGVQRRTAAGTTAPVPWRYCPDVRQGIGEANWLRVVTQGELATIYVNNHKVCQFRGNPPAKTYVGVSCTSSTVATRWEFQNLTVGRPSATDGAPSSAVGDSKFLVDPFTILDPGWGVTLSQAYVRDGFLNFNRSKDFVTTVLHEGMKFTDALLSVTVKHSAEAKGAQGLLFWAADTDNLYWAALRPDGNFGIWRRKEGNWKTLAVNTTTAAKLEADAVNRITVATRGQTAQVFLNGRSIYTLSKMEHPENWQFGLRVEGSSGTQWQFGDLQVHRVRSLADGNDAQLISTDDFTGVEPNWAVPYESQFVSQGKMIIQPRPNKSLRFLYPETFDASLKEAIVVRLQIDERAQAADAAVGLTLEDKSGDNQLLALLKADGKVELWRKRLVGSGMTKAHVFDGKAVLAPGGKPNILTVEMRFGELGWESYVYLNDVLAGSSDVSLKEAQAGIYGESGSDRGRWAISKYSVRKVPVSELK